MSPLPVTELSREALYGALSRSLRRRQEDGHRWAEPALAALYSRLDTALANSKTIGEVARRMGVAL